MTMRPWSGEIYLGSGWIVYRGTLGSTDLHAHHALQAVFADSPIAVIDGAGRETLTSVAIIPADAPHQLRAEAVEAMIVYRDPFIVAGSPRPQDDEVVTEAARVAQRLLPGRVALGEVAAEIGISPSRLTHRFTAIMGLPFRRWVLWERLKLSMGEVASGETLTTSAHRAGFADSAHLNRTFRRMFGVAPSDVAGFATWHVAR